jgi:hypothetical protein
LIALDQVVQQLMAEYERIWGKDPGRRIGGKARASRAYRDPVTKRFVANPVALSTPGPIDSENGDQKPATVELTVAGAPIEHDPQEPEQTHTRRVHELVGKSITQSKDAIK